MELVHTDGEETTGDENKITAKFQAVMANLDSGDPVTSGSNYYITAGASYANDEYVWIGQKKVTTKLLSDVSNIINFFEGN